MAKVKDVLGQGPQFTIKPYAGTTIDPAKIWARYDHESDHMIIYFNGSPQPAVSVYTDENLYIMVDPRNRQVVGLQVENWEQSFVPAHHELQAVWSQLKQNINGDQLVNALLRMLAFWTVSVLRTEGGSNPVLQPA